MLAARRKRQIFEISIAPVLPMKIQRIAAFSREKCLGYLHLGHIALNASVNHGFALPMCRDLM